MQGFYICPDKAFREWWIARDQEPIPKEWVIPVLAARHRYPESPQLQKKHHDKFVQKIGLISTVQQPCLYSSSIERYTFYFKQQVIMT
jgi:hypothetical protein